jgi:alpha-beta hydrolase superfamily lysophospholipase
MSRHYFDLPVPGYSFAEYAAAAGFVTVLVDHPGVGDSDVPDDGWTLTPQVVGAVDAAAVRYVLNLLESGSVRGLPALQPSVVIGVGHSAGAHLVLHQQADARPYDAMVLLGWGGHGLPEYLDENERTLGADSDLLESQLVEGARRRFGQPFVGQRPGNSRLLLSDRVSSDGRHALLGAHSRLFAVVGYATLIPGSAAAAATTVDVPLFLGVGERDIVVRHHELPAEFPAARDISLFILEGAGHNHNVEPNRELLWRRIADWASGHGNC